MRVSGLSVAATWSDEELPPIAPGIDHCHQKGEGPLDGPGQPVRIDDPGRAVFDPWLAPTGSSSKPSAKRAKKG